MEILAHHPFRVTRDADFELEDEDEDLLEAIESVLTLRKRSGHVVRLEVDTHDERGGARAAVPRARALRATTSTIVDAPLDLSGLWALYSARPARAQGPAVAAADPAGAHPHRSARRTCSACCRRATCSCTTRTTRSRRASRRSSTRRAATRACSRSSRRCTAPPGPEGAIVASLVRAADAGKQVVALVELKARFDEQANVERARELEEAGVHVVYGLVGLKTHTKILLVVRQEHDGIRRYCHIGTGNYNPVTANLYEDIGLLTADPELGADLTELFNYLTGYSRQGRYRKLLVAPVSLRAAHRRAHRARDRAGARRVASS